MISPCGMVTCSAGLFLQLSPAKGLHQDRENGPPNAICIASQHGTFPHFPVSPLRRSIPWRRHNGIVRWKQLSQQDCMFITYSHHQPLLWHRVDDSTQTATTHYGLALWASSSDTLGTFPDLKIGWSLELKVRKDFIKVCLNTKLICPMNVVRVSGQWCYRQLFLPSVSAQ